MTSFSGVTFVLICFVFFVFMISLKPRPFVQLSFDMKARFDSYTFSFLFSFCLFGDVVLSEYFLYHSMPFSL